MVCTTPGVQELPYHIWRTAGKGFGVLETPAGEGQLLQYVDDLLIATQTQEACVDWTVSLLNFWACRGIGYPKRKPRW